MAKAQTETDGPAIVTIGDISSVRVSELDKLAEELIRLNANSLDEDNAIGAASRAANKVIPAFMSALSEELKRKPRVDSREIARGMAILLGRLLGIIVINMARDDMMEGALNDLITHVYSLAWDDIASYTEQKNSGGNA